MKCHSVSIRVDKSKKTDTVKCDAGVEKLRLMPAGGTVLVKVPVDLCPSNITPGSASDRCDMYQNVQ